MVDRNTTGQERFFDEKEIIVSKTDLKGHLTYCNDIFLKIADYTEKECLGEAHSMIRHPDMPRAIFKLLWDSIQGGEEIFAYVVNRTKNGDHYWVLAHVTPSRNEGGQVIGYHSNRRVPNPSTIRDVIQPLYRDLSATENQHGNRKSGLDASHQQVLDMLSSKGMGYGEFISTLTRA